jgi:hypothetical protein
MGGRPKGRPLPQEHRERIRAAMQRVSAFTPVRLAADAGNEREAIRLLRAYIRDRKEAA